MNKTIFLFGCLFIWILSSCATSKQKLLVETESSIPGYDNSISDDEVFDIAEATFRYQFQHNASGAQQSADAYFLSLFKKNPPAEFLRRFESNKPHVKNGSEFEMGKGLEFQIVNIHRVTMTKVKVNGGYYEGGLSSSGNTYIVEKVEGKWIVTSSKMHWIS